MNSPAKISIWENLDPRIKKNFQTGVAGVVSGGFAALFTCPFDVIKTRLQVQKISGNPNDARLFALGVSIWKSEGFRGYYRGLGTILFALMPNWACFFTFYNEFKSLGEESFAPNSPMLHAFSAFGAATITNVVTQPIFTIKTRLQTQNMRSPTQQYRGTFHAFRTILRTEGIRALYSGLLAQSIGGIHVIIQFPAYEKLKMWMKQRKQIKNRQYNTFILSQLNTETTELKLVPTQYEEPSFSENLTPLEIILASSFSKLLGSTLAYPSEVVKSRMQFQRTGDTNRYSGFSNAVYRIWAEEGIRGFYSGLFANMCRVVPACAITFLTYEMVMDRFT